MMVMISTLIRYRSRLLPLVAAASFLTAGAPAVHAADHGDQQFTAAINGAQIAYTITGDSGLPILLIHGYPLDGNLFAKQRRVLGANYRVITVDLRGFGKSVAPDAQGSVDLYANDMLALIAQLNLGPMVVGGHSLGGAIALRMYQLDPTVFFGLILNDAAAFPPTTAEQFMWRGYQQQATESGATSFVSPLIPEFLTGNTRQNRPTPGAEVTSQILGASVNALVGGAHALETRPDFRQVFSTISVPTLLLYGQEDSLTPMEQAKTLNSAIAGSKLVIIPNASHGVIRERAGLSNAAILEWLSTTVAGYIPPPV